MICPLCCKEMELGYLQSSRMIVWDKEKLYGSVLPEQNRGFYVTKGLFKHNSIKSYYCEECALIITKLGDR